MHTAMEIELVTREKFNEDRSTWGGQAAKTAAMQHDKQSKEFQETMRFRSKGETPPARVKSRQSFQRLRRRTSDGVPVFPARPLGDDALCDLPDEELDEIMESALKAVGDAQANEGAAMTAAANAREIVVLEHLHDQRMSLAHATAFHPMRIVSEDELRAS
jgi:hypothetical protein